MRKFVSILNFYKQYNSRAFLQKPISVHIQEAHDISSKRSFTSISGLLDDDVIQNDLINNSK